VEEWFESYYEAFILSTSDPDRDPQMKHAEKAFVALGTNAVPYLVG